MVNNYFWPNITKNIHETSHVVKLSKKHNQNNKYQEVGHQDKIL